MHAFALVAHLNPLMGLYGAFIICTLTALFGGRPGMVSGAAGSMAVVIVALVVQHGVQYLLATVLLGGLIMILFGLLRLGKLVRLVPYPVMLGFVNVSSRWRNWSTSRWVSHGSAVRRCT
ncbi:Sulfate permease family protein [Pseudomonas meliae]|uniref:Sulfate permease family protein n=1 Tax=Pseudomonas meliae TaxID=86176 RepID=A0A0P9ZMY4_9PSED|nr:Sulfate permease family protein [Pseudomonas meliae]